MIQITPQMRLLLAVEPVDFRQGIDGLVALCRQKLAADPRAGAWFIFANRRRRAVKILSYDGQGYWRCQKRLSTGRFDWWPSGAQPHLASHWLARVARRIAADWQELYAPPVYLLETFIDPERFRGTGYRAANWLYLGLTAGLGKDAQSRVPNRSRKQLWVCPLRPNFRRQLGAQGHG
jgi:hypothetical protein